MERCLGQLCSRLPCHAWWTIQQADSSSISSAYSRAPQKQNLIVINTSAPPEVPGVGFYPHNFIMTEPFPQPPSSVPPFSRALPALYVNNLPTAPLSSELHSTDCGRSGWRVYVRVRARKRRNRLCTSFAGLHVKKASLFLEIGCRSESSHMPLHLSISYNPDHCTTKCKTSKKEHRTAFRWDPDKAVSSNIFKEKLTEAYNLLNESVESATKLFTDNLLQAADVMKRTFWFDNSKDRVTNQWFDRECKVKKRETRQALLRFKKTNDDKDKYIILCSKKITVQIYYCREEK